MPQMNLLTMTQSILSDMDFGPVNSISDIVESEQIAQILKDTYFELLEAKEWGRTRKLITLTETGTSTPTVFTIPSTVSKVLDPIKYQDENLAWRNVYRKDWDSFLDLLLGYKSTDSNVTGQTIPNSSLTVYVRNNIQPTWWSSFDDNSIVMDSYLSTTDTFLKEAKLVTYGEVFPTWTTSDTFIPTFPDNQFSYLLNEAKKRSFELLKQALPGSVARQARRAEIRSQSTKAWKQNGYPKGPNFGR